MINQFAMGMKQSCALLILLMLTACAGTSVVSKNAPLVPSYKLDAAQVIWVSSPSIPLETSITIQRPKFLPPLKESDKTAILTPYKPDSNRAMVQLLSFFSKHLVQEVRAQLEKNNVGNGYDVALEFSPVSVHYAVNGDRRIHIRSAIKQRDSKEIWSVTIETHGSKGDNEEVLLGNFVNALMDELKKAGWLKS